MKSTVGNLFAIAFLLCLFLTPAYPQTGVVIQPINLVVDPATDNPPIRLLFPPETFKLTPPKEQGGFFHIKTEANETGSVLKDAVSIYRRADWMKHLKWGDHAAHL